MVLQLSDSSRDRVHGGRNREIVERVLREMEERVSTNQLEKWEWSVSWGKCEEWRRRLGEEKKYILAYDFTPTKRSGVRDTLSACMGACVSVFAFVTKKKKY